MASTASGGYATDQIKLIVLPADRLLYAPPNLALCLSDVSIVGSARKYGDECG